MRWQISGLVDHIIRAVLLGWEPIGSASVVVRSEHANEDGWLFTTDRSRSRGRSGGDWPRTWTGLESRRRRAAALLVREGLGEQRRGNLRRGIVTAGRVESPCLFLLSALGATARRGKRGEEAAGTGRSATGTTAFL